MRVVVFGATGMIGRGVLLEALDSSEVTHVLSVGRREVDLAHPKLRQIVHQDFTDFSAIANDLDGLDACFWCLGTSSAGVDEATYTRITHDYTLAAAAVLLERNPEICFCFVTGAGTDSSESGRAMWARVKGKAENALGRMGFRELVIFRPAFIRSLRGSVPRGTTYRVLYAILGPLDPLLRRFGQSTSTVEIGQAMIAAARGEADQRILDSPDINRLAASGGAEASVEGDLE